MLYTQKAGIIIYLKIKKNIERAYFENRYHNLPEDKMLELKAYQKEYKKNTEK